jgi:hypothetical protein
MITKPEDLEQEPGPINTVVNVATGRWADIQATGIADVGEMVTNFVPGMFSNTAGVAISTMGAVWRKEDKLLKLRQALEIDLQAERGSSRAIRQELDEIDKERDHRISGGVASTIGASIGMAAVSVLMPVAGIPGLLLGLGGAAAGGMGGSMLHDKLLVEETEQRLELLTRVRMAYLQAQDTGVASDVPDAVVFAAMASTVTDEGDRRRLAEMLKKKTGTKFFNQAIADPENLAKLEEMMHDPAVQRILQKSDKVFQLDCEHPEKVIERIAKQINAGRIDPTDMLFKDDDRLTLALLGAEAGMGHPDVRLSASDELSTPTAGPASRRGSPQP